MNKKEENSESFLFTGTVGISFSVTEPIKFFSSYRLQGGRKAASTHTFPSLSFFPFPISCSIQMLPKVCNNSFSFWQILSLHTQPQKP